MLKLFHLFIYFYLFIYLFIIYFYLLYAVKIDIYREKSDIPT